MRVFQFLDHFGERGFYDLRAYDLHLKFQSLELLPDLQGELTRDFSPTLALFSWLYLTERSVATKNLDKTSSLCVAAHVNDEGVNVVEWLTGAFQDLTLAASINVMEYDSNEDTITVFTTATTDDVLLSQDVQSFHGSEFPSGAMTRKLSKLTAPFFFGMAAHLLGHIQSNYTQPAQETGNIKKPFVEAANIYF